MNKAFDIVFNDDSLVVVEKKVKILIQPSPKNEKITLTSILKKELNQKVFPCHRLDRETTGLVIYAKNAGVSQNIMEQFKKGQVKKKYIAFIKGKLKKKSGLLEDYIIDREGKAFGEKVKRAKTFYKVLREAAHYSVVRLEPLTGRTNQLRIQFAKIKHPILGDCKYALRRDFSAIYRWRDLASGGEIRFKRLALHAFYLCFKHPTSKERVELNIDLAYDMKKFLEERG